MARSGSKNVIVTGSKGEANHGMEHMRSKYNMCLDENVCWSGKTMRYARKKLSMIARPP